MIRLFSILSLSGFCLSFVLPSITQDGLLFTHAHINQDILTHYIRKCHRLQTPEVWFLMTNSIIDSSTNKHEAFWSTLSLLLIKHSFAYTYRHKLLVKGFLPSQMLYRDHNTCISWKFWFIIGKLKAEHGKKSGPSENEGDNFKSNNGSKISKLTFGRILTVQVRICLPR